MVIPQRPSQQIRYRGFLLLELWLVIIILSTISPLYWRAIHRAMRVHHHNNTQHHLWITAVNRIHKTMETHPPTTATTLKFCQDDRGMMHACP
jgi:type II secretory pathway component PulJ